MDTTAVDMIEFLNRLDVRQVRAAVRILKCAFLQFEDRHYSEVKFVDIGNAYGVWQR